MIFSVEQTKLGLHVIDPKLELPQPLGGGFNCVLYVYN